MLNARVLLTGLLLMGSVMAQKPSSWTTAQKEWALGTIAILSQLNHNRFDLLAGAENPADVAAKDRDFLVRLWQINSREDLLREIKLRLAHSEDSPRIGWNYPLVINLARCGFTVGYLPEDEAWEIIMPAAQVLQQTFGSWQEMGRAYLEARDAWLNSRDIRKRREGEWAYRTVALNPNGPWRKYPWNLDIGGRRKITMTVEKAAWVMINPHPDGLMCVRLGVPDHTDAGDHTDQQYIAAIENTVGCHPRVTGNSYYRQDWTLDAECEVKSAVHGNQLIAKFRMEEIASKLRGEGFTEMFSYLQHEPHGSSELVPGSYDNFVQNGLQWYIDRRSLKMPVEDAELAYGIPERQVTQLERKNPGPACTIDEAGDREQEIYRAALNYVKELLGNDVGGAFEAMSKEGRKALTRDQLATAARVLQEFKPQHINVQHWYVIELGSKTGASPIENEPLERVVCGNSPEKPDGWVSVAVTNDPEQAHVVFSADSTNHELALTAWLVRQGNQWMVYGFSFSLATLGSKGPIELWEQALRRGVVATS
jgi:hypothetical protein